MDPLRRLVSEAHRRSLWQVLSVYLVGSWAALQVVESLTESAGLPDWVPSFALVLLVIGLPIVLATAIVQEGGPVERDRDPEASGPGGGDPFEPHMALEEEDGGLPGAGDPREDDVRERANLAAGTGSLDLPSTRGSFLERHLTWKRAILGGVAAFTLLGATVAAYFVMWSTGVGPVGNLVAQGVFEERERVVLASFGNATSDRALGTTVTEALRMDLLESPALTVVEPSLVESALRRMERDPDAVLTADAAREVAIREGIKAILHGEVGSVGSGYVLTARLAAAESDRTLAAFRETAEGPDELIGAIDKLSQDVREKAGESLRSIKSGEPLDGYTTSSLEALRKYAQAEREHAAGDREAAVVLLEEALELDPDFAMAWRRLGVHVLNSGRDPAGARDAITRAYELRSRLTSRERHLTTALYHDVVAGNQDRVIQAYEAVLESHPDESTALNNLGRAYTLRGDLDRAVEYYRRAVRGPGWSLTAQTNLIRGLYNLGRPDDAREELSRALSEHPDVPVLMGFRARYLAYDGAYAAADSAYRSLVERFSADPVTVIEATRERAVVALFQGRASEARRLMAEVAELHGSRDQARQALIADRDRSLIGLVALGDTAGALDEIDRAVERRGLESMDPLNRPHLELAALYALAGRPERATGHLDAYDRNAAAEHPDPVTVNLRVVSGGIVALARGRTDEALSDLTEVRGRFGCDRCWRQHVGRALEADGRPEEAAGAYEGFLSGHDHEGFFGVGLWEPWVRERLGRLYEELGRPREAAEHHRAFAEQWADADPGLQGRVERARARAATLSGGAAGGR